MYIWREIKNLKNSLLTGNGDIGNIGLHFFYYRFESRVSKKNPKEKEGKNSNSKFYKFATFILLEMFINNKTVDKEKTK